MFDDLNDFIHSNPDARELKRAVGVQMVLKGYKHREIGESLGVSSGFISKWMRVYKQLGVSGLKLGYSGSVGYLEAEQRQSVLSWLKSKNYWNLGELQEYIEQEYEVVFDSKQSYYTLFEQAGISWKKTHSLQSQGRPQVGREKNRRLAPGWRRIGRNSALESWWSSLRMNAICCGGTYVGMCGRQLSGGSFPPKRALEKQTNVFLCHRERTQQADLLWGSGCLHTTVSNSSG